MEINCSGSTDTESDEITYFIEAYYNSSASSKQFIDSFNGSSYGADINYCQDNGGNVTKYLVLPLNTETVIEANLTLWADYAEDFYCVWDDRSWTRNGNHDIFAIEGFINSENVFDGNEYTFANSTFDSNNSLYVNYTKISDATIDDSGFLIIQDDRWYDDENEEWVYAWSVWEKEINSVCWDQNPLQLMYWAWYNDTCEIEWTYCYNGSKFITDDSWIECEEAYNPPIITSVVMLWDTLPLNPFLEIGTPDGNYEWNITGEFNDLSSSTTEDFSSLINNAFNDGVCDCEGCFTNETECFIPFTFHSDRMSSISANVNVMYYTNNYTTAWFDIGNHTESSVLSWNLIDISSQSGVDLRCRAIDLNGSGEYSGYYEPGTNITIESEGTDLISDFLEIYQQSSLRIFRFVINNTVNSAENFTWEFDSNETGGAVSSTESFGLDDGETMFVYLEYNYTTGGSYEPEVSVSSGEYSDSEKISISI